MLLVAVLLQRSSHVEIWTLFLQMIHFGQFAAVFCLLSAAGALDDEEFYIIEGSVIN